MSWLRAAGRRIGRTILSDPRLGPLFEADVFDASPPRAAQAASVLPGMGQAAAASATAPVVASYEAAIASGLPAFGQAAQASASVPSAEGVVAARLPAFGQAAVAAAAAPGGAATPTVVVLVRLALVRPVQARLSLTRPVVAHLAIEGRRVSMETLTAGSAALIEVTFLDPNKAPITNAGGVALVARPGGAGPLRTYTVAPGGGPGQWRGTILFDAPGRWAVWGQCATPSPEVSAPLWVEVRPGPAA